MTLWKAAGVVWRIPLPPLASRHANACGPEELVPYVCGARDQYYSINGQAFGQCLEEFTLSEPFVAPKDRGARAERRVR